jgi:hypothetical protein
VVFYQHSVKFWQHPLWRQNIFYRFIFVLAGSVATTIVASIATAPLAIYHFQQLPMLSVVANALVTPIMAFVVMPASALAYLTLPFDHVGGWVMWYMGWGVEKTIQIAAWVAKSDFALWRVRGIETPHMILIAFGALWLMLSKDKKAWFGIVPILIGLAMTVTVTQPVLALLPTSGRAIIYAPPGQDIIYYDGRMDKFTRDLLTQYLAKSESAPLAPDIKLLSNIYLARDIVDLPNVCVQPQKIIISRWYIDQRCKGKIIIDRHALEKENGGLVVLEE